MKNITITICSLIMVLLSVSCKKNEYNTTVTEAIDSQTLTLSANQLIYLDWDGGIPIGARVVNKRLVTDAAIEFDIHFPSNQPGYNKIDFVSSGVGGQGALIRSKIRDYKAFSLKFTLVSIDGATSDLTKEIVVGALIGPTADGRLSGYTPVTLSFAPGKTTVVSSIPIFGVTKIYQIGFHANMAKPENWNKAGNTVTIRVEPVENTPIPPWP